MYLCKERQKDNKIHGKYNLGGLRQNTYKHTNPKKRSKKHSKLTKEDKELNREISSKRIIVENIKAFVKRFKIVSKDRYRPQKTLWTAI
ncbi:hypothetical protein AGMMS50233_09370 [Endomicrobiia bacterium]|nr:hypothetical protein AGMMS50233_09370 [Endomicrobiia bacterium]